MTPREYYHHDTGYPVGDVVKARKNMLGLQARIEAYHERQADGR